MVDWGAKAIAAAVSAGHPDPAQFERQMRLESAGYRPDVLDCTYVNSAGVLGIAQLHPLYYSRNIACNPDLALPFAADLMTKAIAGYGSSAKALIAYNWGSGNMANHWDGTFDGLPQETQTYLSVIMGEVEARADLGQVVVRSTPRIGPDVLPDIINQSPDDWTCAIRSTYAALWVLNQIHLRGPSNWEGVKSGMSPRFVTSAQGLKDGSGAGIVQYLSELGEPVKSHNVVDLTKAQVITELNAGNLVLIGGHQWGVAGHWALAVDADEDGSVIIENPAPGYKLGNTPIYDFIRDSWNNSSWSGVVIEVARMEDEVTAPIPIPPSGDPRDQQIVDLQKQVADLSTKLGEAANYDGSVRKGLASVQLQLRGLEDYLEQIGTKKAP